MSCVCVCAHVRAPGVRVTGSCEYSDMLETELATPEERARTLNH